MLFRKEITLLEMNSLSDVRNLVWTKKKTLQSTEPYNILKTLLYVSLLSTPEPLERMEEIS